MVVAETDADTSLDPAFEGVAVTFDPEALVARDDVDVIVLVAARVPHIQQVVVRRGPVTV